MFELVLFAMAFGASALGGLLGMAGGIFVVPALVLFAHVELHTAVAAGIVSVIACSCAGAAPYLNAKLTDVRLAIVLEVATTIGALTGVLLSGLIAARVLYLVFAAVLAISAWQMFARRGTSDERTVEEGERAYDAARLPVAMSLMYGAGMVSALLGIGSGVLKIPAMDTALRLPIKISSATSNFMIGVTAAASGVAYLARGDVVAAIAAPVVLGSVLGALLGAKLLLAAPGSRLRLLFVATLVALCVQMTLAAFGITLAGGGA
jgi:hypothetical protein